MTRELREIQSRDRCGRLLTIAGNPYLFTAPEARGTGVATALLREAGAIAASEGANVVRWITAADNAAALGIYDEVAASTLWITYDMKPAAY